MEFTMSNFDLVVIGHILKERIVFPDGKEIGPLLGGPAAYGSVAAARLGLKTGIVTKAGKDMPKELIGILEEAGVDMRGLKVGDKTTANRLIYDRAGRKRLEFLSKADDILPEDIPAEYLNAACFLIAPVNYEVGEALLKYLGKRKKMMSAELSGFGGASSGKNSAKSPEGKIAYLRKIMPCFKIVKAGREDCNRIFGRDCVSEEILSLFIEWGCKIAVITLGSDGVVGCRKDGKPFRYKALPCVVRDLTGAGDVFHAGFIAEYMRSSSLENALITGMAASASIIQKTGGVSMDRFSDLSAAGVSNVVQVVWHEKIK